MNTHSPRPSATVRFRHACLLALSASLLALAACGGGSKTQTTLPVLAAPTFSPAPGTFSSAQSVTISANAGATIYYTTDGSTPTTSSSAYSAAITVSTTTTINAIASETGYSNSSEATATYTINLPAAATPTFSPTPGTFTSAQSVMLADATTGATIYYTLDGSTPSSSSTKYTTAISITSTTTINAIAIASGYANSAVATGVYTINIPVVATPTFTPAPGNYTSAQTVMLSDATSGSTIYYTVDGSAPSTSSPVYSTPIPVAAATTIKTFATAPGDTPSGVATGAYTIGAAPPTVSVVLSTHDQVNLLAPQTAITFGSSPAIANQIIVDDTQTYQSIEGFGAAFTDSACYLLEQVALSSQLTSTLSDLFTRNGNGIGLSFMRDPMGASDLARSVYSYDDEPSGQTDPNLANFSVAHDQTYIIPLIKAAKALNPQMKLMSNPWSPPGWMKSTDTMLGGNLNSSAYTSFANYFVKFLQAYQAAGIPVDYISLQNEPLNNTTAYPSMYVDAPTELAVLKGSVLPALTAAGLSTKVFVWDHNWDTPSYPTTVLSDPTVMASPLVAGTAWHGYSGPPGAPQTLANQFPNFGNWETEHSGGTFIADQFTDDFVEITLEMRSAAKSYVKWSLALDQTLGPNLSQVPGGGYGGCNTCTPIVTVNSGTGNITKDIEFYTLGQYSKYVLPGAVRVWSSDSPTIVSVAFVNPDGSNALIAFNNSSSSSTFQVQWGNQNFSYTLPAFAAATFTWAGSQSGNATQPATQQIQGASYNSDSGVEVEENADTSGSYDIGYIVAGGYTEYKNVNFGAGVSKVNVRVASGGGGGTVSFYLDSMTGTPIASANVASTNGYQNWVTLTAPVSAASGTHTVYAVFTGTATNGLFNMNWFQFQ